METNYEEIYKEGYLDALEYVNGMLDNTLNQQAIDVIPGRVAIQILKATLIPEWDKNVGG